MSRWTDCLSIGRAVIKLLTGNPVEIEEFVSAGGLDAIDRLLFRSKSDPKMRKFEDVQPLKLPQERTRGPTTRR